MLQATSIVSEQNSTVTIEITTVVIRGSAFVNLAELATALEQTGVQDIDAVIESLRAAAQEVKGC